MKRVLLIIFLTLFLVSIFILVLNTLHEKSENIETGSKIESNKSIVHMQLTSSAFENNSKIPPKYTCDAENISPPLQIRDVPSGTKSLVLIVDDPDAPSGDWVHWLVWDIKPNTNLIEEGQIPEGAYQGVNDFGEQNYGGPCPPSGVHRYFFKLYALDKTLNLSGEVRKKDLEFQMQGHILGKAELIGLYQRG